MPQVDPRIVAATRRQLDAWHGALRDGAERVGWKIALGIDEIEALVGADPVLGHITTDTLLQPGGEFAGAAAVRRLRAETELAVEVGQDKTVAGLAEVVAAIAALLEAAGERLQPGDRILAGSACHVPVEPGDLVVAEIDGLGTVAATIAR